MTMLIQWAATFSILILAVVLVRALLGRRMGAGLRYALWGLVLLRLLIPVQLFSVPVPEPVREALEYHQTQTIDPAPIVPPTGDEAPGTVVLTPATQAPGAVQEDAPPAIPDTPATPVAPAPEPFHWQGALGWLWLGGGIAMGLALTVCNVRFAVDLRRRRRAVEADCKLPVYAVEGLESPCLFGVVRPAVYLAPETAQNPVMLRHVLAHEATHARHGDQVWSLLRCAALAVHWWNPLVWLAAFLSRRDAELACDEGAIKLLGDNERKAYGWTLLTLITAQPSPVSLMNAATTMSGGKKALWERVQRIAHAQKKAIWAAALAIVLAVAVTACAFSSAAAPKEGPGENPEPTTSESPEPAQSEPPAVSADPTAAQAARWALYRVLTEAEDIEFSSGNQSDDHVVNPANVTNLRPALGGDQGGGVLTPQEFTVLDLDGDGVDEAVLRAGDTDGWVFVLHYENGGVRGYYYYIRWFNAWALKADGTAPNSSSAAESGVGRLRFPGDGTVSTEDVLYQLPVDGDWSNMRYTVNGEEVSEAEYNAAFDRWDAQPEAPWYDFTQENLDALLGGESAFPAVYHAVLSGADTFQYVSDGKAAAKRFSDVPALFDPYDSYMQLWNFAVVDLDGDGEMEMVFTVSGVSGDMGGYLVLHRMDGQVYGYSSGFRTFGDLRTDGTFECTDPTGKRELFVCRASFSKTAMTLTKLTSEVDSSGQGEGYDTYYVNGKTVARAEYDAAYAAWEAQPNAVWYDFTQENIDAQLGGRG